MSQKKEFKLSYFPLTGRGELCRYMLALAGQDFEDDRVTFEDWGKLKPSTPFGALPVLYAKGKNPVCQSGAIARYIAKKFGFFGSNPWEELLCDEAVECVNDLIAETGKIHFEKDEAKKAEMQEKFTKETIPKFMAYIRLRQKNDGKNGYLVGSKMSIADVAIFNFIEQLKSRGIPAFDSQADIMKHFNMVNSNANIKKYLANRPKSAF